MGFLFEACGNRGRGECWRRAGHKRVSRSEGGCKIRSIEQTGSGAAVAQSKFAFEGVVVWLAREIAGRKLFYYLAALKMEAGIRSGRTM